MKIVALIVALATSFALCLPRQPGDDSGEGSDWVKHSNAETQTVFNLMAKYSPEATGHYGLAAQEIDRYTFWMPGQEPSHLLRTHEIKLQPLRAEAEPQLTDHFNQRAFHDFILGQGLLTLDLSRQAVFDEFVPHWNVNFSVVGADHGFAVSDFAADRV
jgi:hypothetical protein